MGDRYGIIRMVLDPVFCGWPIMRDRQIVYMVSKDWVFRLCASMHINYLDITNFTIDKVAPVDGLCRWLLKRSCEMTWVDFLVADEKELLAEKVWAINRANKKAKTKKETPANNINNIPFKDLLTPAEIKRAEAYNEMFATADPEVWDLGQNPRQRALRSKEGVLHTMIKGAGLTWSKIHGRWLCPIEVWTAMGFPTAPLLQCKSGVESHVSRGRAPPSTRSRNSSVNQAGNAMHVNVIGGASLAALLIFNDLGRRESSSSEVRGSVGSGSSSGSRSSNDRCTVKGQGAHGSKRLFSELLSSSQGSDN